MTPPARTTLRRDILSTYAASGAKVLSWVIVSAILFRAEAGSFGMLALIRGTIGMLTYTTLGLSPALIHSLSTAQRRGVLLGPVYAAGQLASWIAGGLGIVLAAAYAIAFRLIHIVPDNWNDIGWAAFSMGAGTVLRLMSDAPSALIQTRRSIARDSALALAAEVVWIVATLLLVQREAPQGAALLGASIAYVISGASLYAARTLLARPLVRWQPAGPMPGRVREAKRLLAFGSIVTLGQVADFLYAPTDFILINRLISPFAVTTYAAAVQIDAALLLLVASLAAVILPRASIAFAGGNVDLLRKYYITGTCISAALLVAGALSVYLTSYRIFELWLAHPMHNTRVILPWVLLHTILGGSAAVGRSILLGMGKVRPFAIAAVVAGVANVILSFSFVKFFGLGLNGIIYGTIATVVGRCVLWQPWYVMRTLSREGNAALTSFDADVMRNAPEPL